MPSRSTRSRRVGRVAGGGPGARLDRSIRGCQSWPSPLGAVPGCHVPQGHPANIEGLVRMNEPVHGVDKLSDKATADSVVIREGDTVFHAGPLTNKALASNWRVADLHTVPRRPFPATISRATVAAAMHTEAEAHTFPGMTVYWRDDPYRRATETRSTINKPWHQCGPLLSRQRNRQAPHSIENRRRHTSDVVQTSSPAAEKDVRVSAFAWRLRRFGVQPSRTPCTDLLTPHTH